MLSSVRKTYDAPFEAKEDFKAAKREKTIAHITREFGLHPNPIQSWRNHLMEQLPELISSRPPQQEKAREELEAELYQQIGKLKLELERLRKTPQMLLSCLSRPKLKKC